MRDNPLRDPWQFLHGVPFTALAACAVAIGLWLPTDPLMQWPSIDTAQAQQVDAAAASGVNRARKGDRLARGPQTDAKRITTIEIVGVNDVTIIYRDAEGRQVFRTNPVSNATITAKDIVLPALTIRDSDTTGTAPVTVSPSTFRPVRMEKELPVGCESPFSPYADPLAPRVTGRCVSQAAPERQFASAEHLNAN
jgi:hypothetical protein